jgi:hypothetical protein
MNHRQWIAVLLVAWLAGCGPRFYAETPPPIGKTAILDTKEDLLQLSHGAAVAFIYGVSPGQTRIRITVDGSDDYVTVTVEP